jgi:chromosome segregation ATPase
LINGNHSECYFLDEKEERDKVREKIWEKIGVVDDVIKQTYNALEAFQREIRDNDSVQDKHIEELKAMLQELAASQHGTDEEMQQIKLQIGTLRSDIADLRSHLDNGYSKKLISEITTELLQLVKVMNENNHRINEAKITGENSIKISEAEIKKIKMQKRFEFWTKLLTTGGILFFLVTEIIRYILH